MAKVPSVIADFTSIRGIGLVRASRLTAAGLNTYAELADTPAEQLAALSGCSIEQIIREKWISQAGTLATEGATSPPLEREAPPERLNFTLELKTDPSSGAIRSTKAVHVQDPDGGQSWSGWNPDALVAFITSRFSHPAPVRDDSLGSAPGEIPDDVPRQAVTRLPAASAALVAMVAGERQLEDELPSQFRLVLEPTALDGIDLARAWVGVELYAEPTGAPFRKSRLIGQALCELDLASPNEISVSVAPIEQEGLLAVFAVVKIAGHEEAGDARVVDLPTAMLVA